MTQGLTYEVNEQEGSITCHMCGFKSYNPGDVQGHYCHRCRIFHDDVLSMACPCCGDMVFRTDLLSPMKCNGLLMHYECGLHLAVGPSTPKS